MAKTNRVVVPACKEMLNQMKYEIAGELGLYSAPAPGSADTEFAGELGASGPASAPGSIHWSSLATRQAGSVGGEITKRLVAKAEQSMLGL
ncbi:small, acid-soluble spore protein, alpha/beta type [Paenibacillus pasadenensis]|uniref:Small acid-soluble spore protein alpha/beta type n=1 Tax=Paenibacillus pasadenensis TaxID=217090 RepID=A0A2N5NDL9_9BACL|nr:MULTISPECIES: alpha/beta-type small acid-soluble spore protein [Paenibacillus]PLT48412.1 small acid-soluble spore protein alpha/beta type [Paenibacillus pasadenensis]QGG58114.1 small, acid-soluble spore protein, alpha/beta type [Paenibacillus sp. B01]